MKPKPLLNINPDLIKSKDPEDTKEYFNQVNSEPNLWRLVAEALPPKVIVENEIFPREWEIYNCTTCKRGLIVPEFPENKEEYICRCRWDGRMHIGPRWNDTGCPYFDARIQHPKHGFQPGLESGPYSPQEHR
jgi:hypothetical protein